MQVLKDSRGAASARTIVGQINQAEKTLLAIEL